jgi:predicted nucleic acid-binding protein
VTRILVDTSVLLALLDADDPRQVAVRNAFADQTDNELVTHGYVVAESIAVARRRLGVEGVIILLDDVLPAIELVEVDAATHATAQARYRASLPSGTSFVDQVSLAVIERDGIDTVLVLDPDFVRPGLTIIPDLRT